MKPDDELLEATKFVGVVGTDTIKSACLTSFNNSNSVFPVVKLVVKEFIL